MPIFIEIKILPLRKHTKKIITNRIHNLLEPAKICLQSRFGYGTFLAAFTTASRSGILFTISTNQPWSYLDNKT